jgi:23S rRNA (cytosine1962-C5)-methyltransferase
VSAYRLINGAADDAPGLAVDRYADVAVVHADDLEIAETWLPDLRGELDQLCATGYVKVHTRGLNQLKGQDTPAWGPPREEGTVTEYGVEYVVRPAAGLSVGLFLDMREVRQWLRQQSSGKQVLNLFAYTCSLGVCTALGGAKRVVNLDVSRPYLDWGKANYALNGLPVDPHDFIYGDAFDWLARFARRHQLFEIVIVDPPSFSSTPFSVTRDYARLVESAVSVVAPGGSLVAACNHAATSVRRFEGWLAKGISSAGRGGHISQRWHEPPADFPVPGGGRPYLKVRAVELD